MKRNIREFLPEIIISVYILVINLMWKNLIKLMWAMLLIWIIFYTSMVLRKLYELRTIFLLYILLLFYGISYYIVTTDLEILTILPFLFLLSIYKYKDEIFTKIKTVERDGHW